MNADSNFIALLRQHANDPYPNDKDLISGRENLRIIPHGPESERTYLICDDSGYLTYVETVEDLIQCLVLHMERPVLRQRLMVQPQQFKTRRNSVAPTAVPFDISKLEF